MRSRTGKELNCGRGAKSDDKLASTSAKWGADNRVDDDVVCIVEWGRAAAARMNINQL